MATNYTLDAYETYVQRTDTNLGDSSAKMWNGYSDGPVQENYTKFFWDGKDWAGGADWIVTEVGTCTQTLSDEAGGAVVLTTGGTEDDGISMQQGKPSDSGAGEWVLPRANKNIYFEVTAALNDATQSDIFIGLTTTDTAITASLPSNYIGFLKVDGATGISANTVATAGSQQTTGVKTMDTAYHKYGFKVTGLTKVEFYIDDVIVATHTTVAAIPVTEMRPSIEVLTGEGNACALTVKRVRVAAQN